MISSDFIADVADNYFLTEAEVSVLNLKFKHGKINSDIAKEMKIDVSAVNHRMSKIYEKLEIKGENCQKNVELRVWLNNGYKIYCQNQSKDTSTNKSLHHVNQEIYRLKLELSTIKKSLERILPIFNLIYSQNSIDNNYLNNSEDLASLLDELEDKLKNPNDETSAKYIIDNMGNILNNSLGNNENQNRDTLLKVLEFFKSIALAEARYSTRDCSTTTNSEVNLDS